VTQCVASLSALRMLHAAWAGCYPPLSAPQPHIASTLQGHFQPRCTPTRWSTSACPTSCSQPLSPLTSHPTRPYPQVFDECHNATGVSPMGALLDQMRAAAGGQVQIPKVVGLTASPGAKDSTVRGHSPGGWVVVCSVGVFHTWPECVLIESQQVAAVSWQHQRCCLPRLGRSLGGCPRPSHTPRPTLLYPLQQDATVAAILELMGRFLASKGRLIHLDESHPEVAPYVAQPGNHEM